ncbi:MAG: cytochrome C oxidase subunit IV family protein [Flavobacteriaceae bacterium]|nr:cytochrome C oxidase subunit IV family protein [Flavobacteriaceae bacterium]
MKSNTSFIVWIGLMVLTLATGLLTSINGRYVLIAIITLSFVKFMGVALYFMELNKAHIFWRISLICFLVIFGCTLLFLSN